MTPPPPTVPGANPFPAPPAPPAPPKRTKVLLVVAAVLVVPFALCLLVGGLGMLLEKSAKPVALRPGDREALVTADDLLASTANPARADPKGEKVERRQLFDGSGELNYEYESKQPPLYVASNLSLEKTAADAKTSYLSQAVGGSVGLTMLGEGMKAEDKDLLRWGDESKSQLLVLNGNPVGNFFVARKGTRVAVFIFTGVYFDDAEAFRSVVEPKLQALERLEP